MTYTKKKYMYDFLFYLTFIYLFEKLDIVNITKKIENCSEYKKKSKTNQQAPQEVARKKTKNYTQTKLYTSKSAIWTSSPTALVFPTCLNPSRDPSHRNPLNGRDQVFIQKS